MTSIWSLAALCPIDRRRICFRPYIVFAISSSCLLIDSRCRYFFIRCGDFRTLSRGLLNCNWLCNRSFSLDVNRLRFTCPTAPDSLILRPRVGSAGNCPNNSVTIRSFLTIINFRTCKLRLVSLGGSITCLTGLL